jgi:hypothetical protein
MHRCIEDETMNKLLHLAGRNIRTACLPLVLALGYLGAASAAMAPLATGSPSIATSAAASPAPDLGTAGRWLRPVSEQESDDHADLPPGAKITREQASAIALRVVAGEVTSVDVERKLGRIVYTVEIMTPAGDETDVLVDVETGKVLGTE